MRRSRVLRAWRLGCVDGGWWRPLSGDPSGPRRSGADWGERRLPTRRLALQRCVAGLRLRRDGIGRLGRGGDHLPAAAVGRAHPRRRHARRPLRQADRAAAGGHGAVRAHARAGRGGGLRRPGGAGSRADDAGLGCRERGAARHDRAAPATGRRVALGSGQRAAAHGAGARSRPGPCDRRGPAARRSGLRRLPGQRRELRVLGRIDLDDSPQGRGRGRDRLPAAPGNSSDGGCGSRGVRGSWCR